MRFSAPVFFDDKENMFLAEGKKIREFHLQSLIRWNIEYVYTYGRILKEDEIAGSSSAEPDEVEVLDEVEEVEIASDKEHFHVGFMWDSSKIQRALKIAIMLNSQLTEALNLTEHHHCVNVNPPNPILDRQFDLNCVSNQTLKIRKGNPGFKEQRANIIGWLSYLAKVETKGNWREKHIREFGFSLCNRKGRLNATQF